VPADVPARMVQKSMQQALQHALSLAVGPEDDGARSRLDGKRHPADDRLCAARVRNIVQGERQNHPKRRCAASLTSCAVAFRASTMAIRTTPRPRASERSPFEVSSAMAVVMTR